MVYDAFMIFGQSVEHKNLPGVFVGLRIIAVINPVRSHYTILTWHAAGAGGEEVLLSPRSDIAGALLRPVCILPDPVNSARAYLG